ncbi:MAG: GNAT family N-acetyltransferase [Verrucomicrobiales bacterium]|nr:GNAT family N-acetyltransferase [Verrucomicrobiales bacterium]
MNASTEWTVVHTDSLDLNAFAALFNRAFADYLVRFPPMDGPAFQRLLAGQGIDLAWSRLVAAKGAPAGFGLIHRSNQMCRLAAMGVVPAARGRGAAGALLDALLEEAEARGDHGMTLEVFEQNPPALQLYLSRGFLRHVRLLGWRRDLVAAPALAPSGHGADSMIRVPLGEASAWQTSDPRHAGYAFTFPRLPFQVSGMAVPRLPASAKAYRIADTLAVVNETEPGSMRWCALLPPPAAASPWSLLKSAALRVMAEFPEHRWSAPAIFPEAYGEHVFEPLGFTREPLHQWLMFRKLGTGQQVP